MDVLSASLFDNKIAWYENTDGAGSFGIQQVITTAARLARSCMPRTWTETETWTSSPHPRTTIR